MHLFSLKNYRTPTSYRTFPYNNNNSGVPGVGFGVEMEFYANKN